MKKTIIAVALVSVAVTGPLSAKSLTDMVGAWRWNDFVINCAEGGTHGLSCTVSEGPKNKGMEMIQSKLVSQGDVFFGKLKHPATGTTFNARINAEKANVWSIVGCTDGTGGACAGGDFVRMK